MVSQDVANVYDIEAAAVQAGSVELAKENCGLGLGSACFVSHV